MTTPGPEKLLHGVEQLEPLTDPRFRAAFDRVDRGAFVPSTVWPYDDSDGHFWPLDRDTYRDLWQDIVYSNEPVITQVDERGASSSASMPSVVFMMLRHLDIANGMRVLEAGTGTGYNAALLSYLAGDANVTTVETDADIAAAATAALKRNGFHPHVVTRDGSQGYPPNAPYDRIIATYAVQFVPYAWVEQCRSGGLIVTPWGTPFDDNVLLRLTVHDDHTASGHFIDTVNFMSDRGQRPEHPFIRDTVSDDHEVAMSHADLDPRAVLDDEHAAFTIGLRVPDCHESTVHAADDTGRFTLWVLAHDSTSWASVSFDPTEAGWEVRQHGRRRLWDEVEAAYRWWIDAGRPERERYGVTITRDGQEIWLDHPTGEHA